ncbi:WD40 repeat domain-containing serine/threonine protein kinase [Streptomyces fungicidicus]|uniref:WD40 repeat domain-containing serine/threonine protein kinase n=1 Tax=Streptomyces fungicidicus TaxID=68203 RepID=UPI0033269B25
MTGTAGLRVGGRYRLVEPIGRGGMGRVWRGRDEVLDREVAVKEVLFPADLPDATRDKLTTRTLREARAAARLQHPGIVTVFDVTEHDEAPWIVMEFVRGPSLATHLAENGRLGWERAARVGGDLADALAHAHAAGVVHRDLKPDNVLLTGDRVLITDFGIAHLMDEVSGLTTTNTIVGTLQYMAPERLEGRRAEGPVDLWALGATLYTAVEGQPPFDGPTQTAVITAILTAPSPAAPHAGHLGDVLRDLMAKDPQQRPDAAEITRRLRELRTSLPESTARSAPLPTTALTARLSTPPDDNEPTAPRRPSRRTLLIGSGAALAAVTGAVTAVRLIGADPEDESWFRLTGHDSQVNTVAFSPDGRTLASGSGDYLADNDDDRTLRLWDLTRRTATAVLTGHAQSVDSVAFSPDGKTLASAGYDSTVRLWDVANRTLTGTLTGHNSGVSSVAFSPDGKALASGGLDDDVRLWNVATRSERATLADHASVVASLAFSLDGKILASGSGDTSIRLRTATDGKVTGTLTGHTETVMSMAFSPDGTTLASGSFDKTVRFWDVAARSGRVTLDAGDYVMSVAFSPDGRTLAAGGGDNTVRLWDATDGSEISTLTGHTDTVTSVAFSPNGKTLASGGSDGTVRVWKV